MATATRRRRRRRARRERRPRSGPKRARRWRRRRRCRRRPAAGRRRCGPSAPRARHRSASRRPRSARDDRAVRWRGRESNPAGRRNRAPKAPPPSRRASHRQRRQVCRSIRPECPRLHAAHTPTPLVGDAIQTSRGPGAILPQLCWGRWRHRAAKDARPSTGYGAGWGVVRCCNLGSDCTTVTLSLCRAIPAFRAPSGPPGHLPRLRGEGGALRYPLSRISRDLSRFQSRSFSVSRLSCIFLPRPSAMAILARPLALK